MIPSCKDRRNTAADEEQARIAEYVQQRIISLIPPPAEFPSATFSELIHPSLVLLKSVEEDRDQGLLRTHILLFNACAIRCISIDGEESDVVAVGTADTEHHPI